MDCLLIDHATLIKTRDISCRGAAPFNKALQRIEKFDDAPKNIDLGDGQLTW